jgi:hypothetical protein
VNSDRGSYVQAGLSPQLKSKVELSMSGLRGDGRSDEVIVCRIKKNYGWAHLGAGRLMKVDPNQDNLTGSEGH